MHYFIILCGGSGTRLWPLSTKNKPKQLLPFLNKKSLLEETIDRVHKISGDKQNIGIVTTKEQMELIPGKIKEKVGLLMQEPTPRNTGPAILYSCLKIAHEDPEAIVTFLPADHFIPEGKKYCECLKNAIAYAQNHDKIVTLGLMPTHPATGYGYIQAEAETVQAGTVYNVKKFHEKPDKARAEAYVAQGDMFWNLGMFIGKVKLFCEEYKALVPEMFACVNTYVETGKKYEQTPSISIDYAIMEKSKKIAVIPCDFIWNDVGNLDLFVSLQQKYGAPPGHKIISIDAKNNIAKTNKKIVTFIGVDDLCVIEEGDVIVVAKRSKVEKVKQACQTTPQ